jgi:hypothetical protein
MSKELNALVDRIVSTQPGARPKGQTKVAAAKPAAQQMDKEAEAALNQIKLNLGNRRLQEIVKEAHVKMAAAEVDAGLEKVASGVIQFAAQNGVLEAFIKEAAGGNAELEAVMTDVIRESLEG